MKKKLIYMLGLFLILCSSEFALAVVCMNDIHPRLEKFEPVYTDNSLKLKWGRPLVYSYSNGCRSSEDGMYNGWPEYEFCTYYQSSKDSYLDDSANSCVEQACNRIGSRLPTREEYISLLKNFEHQGNDSNIRLTQKGLAQMNKAFGKLRGGFYWTSTLFVGAQGVYIEWSTVFNSSRGEFAGIHRGGINSALCVSDH